MEATITDSLLIRHQILQEISKEIFRTAGNKHYKDVPVLCDLIEANVINAGASKQDTDKAFGNLVAEEYIRITSPDASNRIMYITLKSKGFIAITSDYFKEKYKEKFDANRKYWVNIIFEFLSIVALLFALLKDTKGCKKELNSTQLQQSTKNQNTLNPTSQNASRLHFLHMI